jgi:predicted nucleic acid-binding protein
VLVVVDSGPLYASVDRNDADHEVCAAQLLRPDLDLVVPALVVAEVTYLIGLRLGPAIESRFLGGLVDVRVEAPFPEDWERIAELVSRYRDFPLGGTDASVVTLAERLNTDLVLTLDERHFRAIRPRHCPALRLLPGDA